MVNKWNVTILKEIFKVWCYHSHHRKVLFTETREEEVEDPDIETYGAKIWLFQQKGSWLVWAFFFSTNDHMLFFIISLKNSFFVDAGFYCRTLKCLCWDLLQNIFFGLPSFPSPKNVGCCWSFEVMSLCPLPCGQYPMGTQHGGLLAGRGTARETTSVHGQPQHPPWKPQTSVDRLRGCSSAHFPLALWGEGLSRHQEQTWVLVFSVPGWFCGGVTLPESTLPGIWPHARLDTSTRHGRKNWRALPRSGLPRFSFGFSRVMTLQTPRVTITTVPELSKHPGLVLLQRCPPASSMCWGQFADEGAQCSHLVTMPWPQRCSKLLVLLLRAQRLPSLPLGAFMAQPTTSPSSFPCQHSPNTKISLSVIWLFWLFYILDVLWAHNAQCHVQPIHVFTPILHQVME